MARDVVGPASHRADTGDELRQGEGLGQVVVRPGIEAVHALVDFAARGQQQDGHRVAPFAQLAKDAEAVPSRQHDVQHQRVVRRRLGQMQRVVAIVADVDREALGAERLPDERRGLRVVFDDQDAHGGQ